MNGHLRRIRIVGFKSLANVDLTIDTKEIFFVGPNGSGKSSLLQSIGFLGSFMRGRVDQFFDDRGWSPKEIAPRFAGRQRNLIYHVHVEFPEYSILWRIAWNVQNSSAHAEEVWIRRPGTEPKRVLRFMKSSNSEDLLDSLQLRGSLLSMIGAQALTDDGDDAAAVERLRAWAEGITSLELLSPVAMRRGVRGVPRDIGSRGERLAGFLAGLNAGQKARIVERLARFYPITGLETTRKKAGWVDLKISEVFGDGSTFGANHVSDGFLRLLALCAIPEFDESATLILLDEVEDGLESHILPRVIEAINNESRAQLVMTSHSPILLNYFERNSIFFITREPNGASFAKRLDEISLLDEAAEYFGSGELLANADISQIRDFVLSSRPAPISPPEGRKKVVRSDVEAVTDFLDGK